MEHHQDLSVDQSLNDATSASRPLAPGGSRDVGGVERGFVVHNERPSTARTYRDMTANDNSRVHAGDVYNYNYSSASASTESNIDIPETKIRRLRSALSYPQMGLRSAIVEDACLDTCQWLFKTPEYQRWRDPTLYSKHHGFLWIKGKPGSGKSTAMKTLLSSAESSGNMRSEKVLSYFFNSRGEALERSTEGLYRSLLHQITAGIASLPDDVLRWSNPDSLDLFRRQGWQVDLLKGLFKKVVLLDRRGHLLCFIDALDEGDNERSVRNMVEFLEDLTETARDQHLHFSVCLASRHYPNISLHRLVELQLDDHKEHLNDIEKYVRNKTKVFNTGVSNELVASIKRRSSGVFLWVVLVITKLKRQADHGNEHRLQALLDSIPVGVERLLEDTLKKAGQDDCLVATLQWALFSKRPLKLQEFHTAILLSNGELHAGGMHWDKAITESSTKKFIISASKGLLEIVASDRIQFIHESVREYFLRNGLEQGDHSLKANASGISHHRLAQWCSKYLQLTETTSAIRSSADPFKVWRRGQKAFPLLQYAMGGMLRHAEDAAAYGIQLQAFDETFSFEDYLLVKSRTIGNFGAEKYDTSPTPNALRILIYEQCNRLVEIELSKYQGSLPDEYLTHVIVDPPAHLFSGREELEKPSTDCNYSRAGAGTVCASTSRCIGGPLHTAARKGAVDIALALIKNGASADDHCQTLGTPLLVALRHCDEGQTQMIETLLSHGADIHQKDDEQPTPLQLVLERRRTDLLWILLEWDVDVNASFPACRMGCSPLILAVRTLGRQSPRSDFLPNYYGNLERRIRTFKKNEDHSKPKMGLRDIRFRDMFADIEILLAFGATINAKCNRCGMTAIDMAKREQNMEVQFMLQRYGGKIYEV